MNLKKNIVISIIVFIINFGLDLITKQIAVVYLKGKQPTYFLYDTIMIYYTENSGAFLGMGSNWPVAIKYILLLILPIMLCLYGIYYCIFKENNRIRLIILMSIIGGGLGNLIDRLFNDFSVIDFLNFGIGTLRTGILNVADLSVTFGAIALVIFESKLSKNKKPTIAE